MGIDLSKINIKDVDVKALAYEVLSSVKKPNILVIGATQSGKSTLINDMFSFELAEVGKDGSSTTRGIKKYSPHDSTVTLYDSEGYEVGAENEFKQRVFDFIDKRSASGEPEHYIHEAWYVVDGGKKRFFDLDKEIKNRLQKKHIPVAVVITKVDKLDTDELAQLREEISKNFSTIDIFNYSVMLGHLPENDRKEYVQKEALANWSLFNLEIALQGGLICGLNSALELKNKYCRNVIIPKYCAAAAAAVLIPLPFADSMLLTPIQVSMAMNIMHAYSMKNELKDILGPIIGSTFVANLGKALAGNLASLAPGGQVAKLVVNTAVAVPITATLGVAISYLIENYLKASVNANGNVSFEKMFTAENIRKACEFVSNNKELFGIDKLIKKINSDIEKNKNR